MTETISVIIPTWNRAGMIPRALDSVMVQTLAADEVIVVDDGSTDDTVDFIRRAYPGVRLLVQAHGGVSAARNCGIREAAGNWLAFLDSDDAWLPEKLAQQRSALKSHSGYSLAHTGERWIRNGTPLKQLRKHRRYGGHIFRHCLPLCAMSPSSVMIHRDVFRAVGLFKEHLPVCEDYDMWLRICSRFPVLYLPRELVIKYGGHDTQLSRRYPAMDRYRIMALADILNEAVLEGEDREAAIDMLLEKLDIYLGGAEKHGNTLSVEEFRALRRFYTVNGDSDPPKLNGMIPGP